MRSPQKASDWTQARNVIVPSLDVTDESTITLAIQETVPRFGTIDLLVNNAGYGIALTSIARKYASSLLSM